MPYSLYDQLKLFSPKRFEELCGQLLKADDVSVHPVEGKGGDEGIDIFQGPLDTPKSERTGRKLHVWQVKHFPTGLGPSQKQQALKSLKRVIETQDPDSWTLCVPFHFSLADHRWLDGVQNEHPRVSIELLDAPAIMDLLMRPANRSLLDAHFLLPTDQRVDKQVLALVTDFDLVSERLQPDKLPRKTESAFYDGAVADWKDIYDNLDARREIIGELWDFVIEAEKSTWALVPFAVLTGLSGEGKSTVLMRLAAELVRSGRTEVFWHKPGKNDLSAEQFRHLPPDSLVYIFIDSIMRFGEDVVGGFLQRLRDFPIRPIVVSAAISSQWHAFMLNLMRVADVHEISLGHMSLTDIETLLDKLSENEAHAAANLGKLAEFARGEQVERFTKKANHQLLVALIEAKGGEGFKQHVLDELWRLADHNGELVPLACIFVSAVHRFGLGMPKRLLQRLVGEGFRLEDQVFSKADGLIKLVSQDASVITRHSLIADVIYRSVDDKRHNWYEAIIEKAERSDEVLIARIIREIFLLGDERLSLRLLGLASSQFPWSTVFSQMQGFILNTPVMADGARAMFRRGTEVDPKYAPLWHAWALLEKEEGNIGDKDAPEDGSARWLFRKGTEADPKHAPLWHAWALLEKDQGNIGDKDAPQEWSARWLLVRGVAADPDDAYLRQAFELLDVEAGDAVGNEPIEEQWLAVLDEARGLLARGDWHGARKRLADIPLHQKDLWDGIRGEFAFAFDFSLNDDTDYERWQKALEKSEWRRKVWAALATKERRSGSSVLSHSATEDSALSAVTEPDSGPDGETVVGDADPSTSHRLVPNETNEQRGERLERDTKSLIERLFLAAGNNIEKLRQQWRGAQLGCDLKLEHSISWNHRNARCLVECKSDAKDLSLDRWLVKLYDAKANQVEIDHWILVAPCARALGNIPDGLVERWNIEQEFPFNIQLWTADTGVAEFFGLVPDIYDQWIDHPDGREHPREWSEVEKTRICEKWLRRLAPPLRLPQRWAEYVSSRDGNGLFVESDDRESLTELWKADRYIAPRALDSSRAPLPKPLMESVLSWLEGSDPRVCLLLAEFGDGKSAFTYMLSRHLLRQYLENPQQGWIPLRLPLRQFSRGDFNSREFLRNRLEELGSSLFEWKGIIEKKNVLVILDGMDEMSKTLTTEAVGKAMDRLIQCCHYELEGVRKLLITGRGPFFEELAGRNKLEDRLDRPQILYIEPFHREQIRGKLRELARTAEEMSRLHILSHSYDPLGLAGKALFFKMVATSLSSPHVDFSSETGVYKTFVDNCIMREAQEERLEAIGHDMTRPQLAKGITQIMEQMAMDIQLGEKEYICLKTIEGSEDDKTVADLLWRGIENDSSGCEDALHTVGVRSLLHKKIHGVDEEDAESWPVEFCHRSVREYFVARRVETVLREAPSDAQRMLATVDYNHEILRFVSELMKAAGHDYEPVLRQVALSSRHGNEAISAEDMQSKARLGSTAVTLLYGWRGKLPGNDWSYLILDGAQLAGADLTGKDFRGTSLRSANLNNAILTNADFRDADLTGVRLEETGEVCSLAMPRDQSAFFAAYHDGTIRRWKAAGGRDTDSEIVFTRNERDVRPFRIAALPGQGLCLRIQDRIAFLDPDGDVYKEVSSFDIQSPCAHSVFKEDGVVTIDTVSEDGCLAVVFDFAAEGVPAVKDLVVDPCVSTDATGKLGVAAALDDGRLMIYPMQKESEPCEIARVAAPSSMAVSTSTHADDDSCLIACGERDGTVGLWKGCIDAPAVQSPWEEVFRVKIHDGAVTALCFAGDGRLLSGGTDRKIHLLNIADPPKAPRIMESFELKLRCDGMKISGLKGQPQKAILTAAGAVLE